MRYHEPLRYIVGSLVVGFSSEAINAHGDGTFELGTALLLAGGVGAVTFLLSRVAAVARAEAPALDA